jgi:hypothetical protein
MIFFIMLEFSISNLKNLYLKAFTYKNIKPNGCNGKLINISGMKTSNGNVFDQK